MDWYSTDEVQRMKPARDPYILNRHPLIELNMSRQDCINYLNKKKYLYLKNQLVLFLHSMMISIGIL